LQTREPMMRSRFRFSPDGSLLVAGTPAGYFHVWDLRQIRARLKDMNLDWDLPAFGLASSRLSSGHPLEEDLSLDSGSLIEKANYLLEIQDYRRALADFEEALARDANQPKVCQRLASIFTNGPHPA